MRRLTLVSLVVLAAVAKGGATPFGLRLRPPAMHVRRPRPAAYMAPARRRRPPPAKGISGNTCVMASCIVGYGLQMALGESFTLRFLKDNSKIFNGETYRLVTPVFLHADPTHLLFNAMSLRNIGPEVERWFGRDRFLLTFLAGGVAGNLASLYFTPGMGLGASGGVLGLTGALGVFFYRHKNVLNGADRAMDSIGRSLFLNIVVQSMVGPRNIDNFAHMGGVAGGAAMAYMFGPRYRVSLNPITGRAYITDRPIVDPKRTLARMRGRSHARVLQQAT